MRRWIGYRKITNRIAIVTARELTIFYGLSSSLRKTAANNKERAGEKDPTTIVLAAPISITAK